MACTCVVGLQWGDEAKGKIVDLLTDAHDLVVRYNGGANAGHTVVTNGQTYKLSLLPTGVLKPRLRSVIGNGVVVFPPRFLEEVDTLRKATIRALSPEARTFEADALCDEYLGHGERMRPYITDTTRLLHQALRDGKRILFEAAQGTLLDVDHGTYPYVTSSNSSPAGIWSGSGVPARNLKRIVGVVKAYSTRVGHGPFPTELKDGPDGLGEKIRKTGREYGTVTGRPRRVGWFDAVAARYTAALAGADEIAVMLLDVLSAVKEIGICTAYEIEGRRQTDFPADAYLLDRC